MRVAVSVLLAIHGLIHLVGFVVPWGLAQVPQMTGRTIVTLGPGMARIIGLAWLLAAIVLVVAATLRLAGQEAWWVAGAVGLVLSQGLIVLHWPEARAGTAANLLLLLPVLAGGAIARFHAANDADMRALLARAPAGPAAVVTAADLAALPPPVRRWLEVSGAVGRPRARAVRLVQRGELRTGADKPFVHAEARQVFTVDEPAFVWTVDVTMMGVVPIVGRDRFVDGRGRMFIQAAGLVTVADGTGERFDQGTLLRYLGEIIWFPSAALAPYIRWTAVDERRADASISFRGVEGTVRFELDARGRVERLSARRWLDGKTLEDWVIPVTGWKVVRGIEMPVTGSAVWKLASGDFEYYRWEILDVEENPGSIR